MNQVRVSPVEDRAHLFAPRAIAIEATVFELDARTLDVLDDELDGRDDATCSSRKCP
jgi:hypothetical protein